MRQIFLLLIFTCFLTITYCQQQPSNEIIAEGAAKMKVKPDLAIFTLTLEKRDTSERKAINKLNIAVENLEKALNEIGFSNKAIKISDYDVSSSYNDEKNRKTYTTTNTLKLEFQLDNKLIDAFYTQIQQSNIQDLDIDFDSKLSDSLEKASRHKLVQLAIDDAKTNATNIATALDIKLGRVKQVQKSSTGPITYRLTIAFILTLNYVIGQTLVPDKASAKILGNYFFIPNSSNGRLCSIGRQGQRILKLKENKVFEVYYTSPTDTALFEKGQWDVNADTLILDYKKFITPSNRKKNCYIKSDGNNECFDYELFLIKKRKLYWLNYGKVEKDDFIVWYEKRK